MPAPCSKTTLTCQPKLSTDPGEQPLLSTLILSESLSDLTLFGCRIRRYEIRYRCCIVQIKYGRH
jgi:hypothetical protein